jgi:hypothetical protein
MTSCSSMSETKRISREHFGYRSGSASHAFLINSRHFLEGMRRGSWAETSITSPGVALGLHFFVRLLGPLAAHLVGIPPVVAHELEALVGMCWVIAAISCKG